jgi:hypothetical protein
VVAGKWGLALPADPQHLVEARVRRHGPNGIAEWAGSVVARDALAEVALQMANAASAALAGAAPGAAQSATAQPGALRGSSTGKLETVLAIRLDADHLHGRLYQRRRSERLPLRLSPVRLMPLPQSAGAVTPEPAAPEDPAQTVVDDPDVAPVARLSDVSVTGAAVVVDTPLSEGTTVSLEFELPGEVVPFTVRGRVVEPAVILHGEMQPQPDGLPGFRRGIEFLSYSASRESKRLAAVLGTLLKRSAQRAAGSRQ